MPKEPRSAEEVMRDRAYEEYLKAALQGEFEPPDEFLERCGVEDNGLRAVLQRIFQLRKVEREAEGG